MLNDVMRSWHFAAGGIASAILSSALTKPGGQLQKKTSVARLPTRLLTGGASQDIPSHGLGLAPRQPPSQEILIGHLGPQRSEAAEPSLARSAKVQGPGASQAPPGACEATQAAQSEEARDCKRFASLYQLLQELQPDVSAEPHGNLPPPPPAPAGAVEGAARLGGNSGITGAVGACGWRQGSHEAEAAGRGHGLAFFGSSSTSTGRAMTFEASAMLQRKH